MKISKNMLFGSVLMSGILAFSLYGFGHAFASGYFERMDDDDREYGWRSTMLIPQTASREYAVYREECGSCHMAYPAPLLPMSSWSHLMNGLQDHFGENAEVEQQTAEMISQYLFQGAEMTDYTSRKLFRNRGSISPLRITELPYFRSEHDEIPERFISGNAKVGSLSQCNACHRAAERGQFDEDDVYIAGVGRWDD